MRKITPLPGAYIEVEKDGTIVARNWRIDGETDADDPTDYGRLLAIIDWLRAKAVENHEGRKLIRSFCDAIRSE